MSEEVEIIEETVTEAPTSEPEPIEFTGPTKMVNGVRIQMSEEEVLSITPSEADKLEKLSSDILTLLNAKLDEKWKVIKNGYPDYEINTFDAQVKEAERFQLDSDADIPMIEAARGVTSKEDYCNLVLTNNEIYSAASGTIINMRREFESMLNACESLEDHENLLEVIKNV